MKKSFLLCLLMTLFTTWAVQASELTVHDGTATSNKTPIFVFYFDDYTRSQVVFPAEELADMKNETIMSMKFYTNYTPTNDYETSADVDIYLKEVEEATIDAFVDKDDATIVYHGTLEFIKEGEAGKTAVTIEFDTPFAYNGGNLMFGCDNNTIQTYQSIYFYGETVTGASISGYDVNSLDDVTPTQRDFLPKTTFTYGAPAACPKASGLTISDITSTSARLSWNAIGNASAWNFMGSTESTFPDDANKTFSFNNIPAVFVPGNTVNLADYAAYGAVLQPNTTYYLKLQANCGTDGTGDWSNPVSFRTACSAFTLPFSEGFEEGIDCWKMESVGSYTGLANDESYSGDYSFRFRYNSNPPQYLISPEFTPLDKNVVVDFYYKNSTSDELFQVGYSTTTNNLDAFTWGEEVSVLSGSSWTNYMETLPAGVKFVAIRYNSNNKLSLFIDEFKVYEEPACPKSRNLAVSDVTAHEATFSWTDESENAWQLCLNDGGEDEIISANTNPFIFDELKAETTYSAKVRTKCDEDSYSEWSNVVTFTTDIACYAPTGLEAELIPGNGEIARLTWSADNAENFVLQYSESADFEPAQEINIQGNSMFNLDNLTPDVPYYARVKSDCGEEDGQSAWSNVISFTPTDAYSITVNDGTSTNSYVPVYGTWTDHYSQSQFIIPAANLTEITWGKISQLVFYASNSAVTWTGTEFEAYVAELNETTLSELTDWESMEKVMSAVNLSIVDHQMVVTFDAPYQYMGGNLMIGIKQTVFGGYSGCSWYGIAATGASMGGYVNKSSGNPSISQQNFLPKMTIFYEPGEAPSCPRPIGLAVSNIGGHNATFSWNGESEHGWQICLNDGGEDEFIPVTTNPFTYNELKPETEYTAKLRTICDGSVLSDWSNIVTFTTDVACPAPTNLAVTLTPGNGTIATVAWESAASEWKIEYDTDPEFANAESMSVEGNASAPLTGLTPETTYYAHVMAMCGEEDGDSEWSEAISFKPTNAYSITVNDGTVTNGIVPIYGYWADHISKSQFIIPAANLIDIVYGRITDLTFYASQASVSWSADEFEVYVAEVSETTISELVDWAELEKVMSSASLSVADNQMVVTFDAPYQYLGGNLLIGILETASGSYSSVSWYGLTATGASVGGYDTNISQQNFLPKMTINYTPGEAPSCPKPLNVQAEYNGGTQASISWVSDAAKWNLDVNGTIIPNVTENPYILDCDLATNYEVRVQSICSGDATSDWSSPASFATDICLPENQCEIKLVLTDSYGDGWNGNAIQVTDVATGILLGTFANQNLDGLSNTPETQEFILTVCDGREIRFSWVSGSYANETSYAVYDNRDEEIFSGSGAMAEPVNHIVHCEAPACAKPTNVEVEYYGGTQASISWGSDAAKWNLDINGTIIPNVTENPYTLDCELGTAYEVRVQAVCDGDATSDWTNAVSFTTDLCMPEDMNYISFELTDSYGDGWNGNAALKVVHKATNIEIASLSVVANASSAEGGLHLCCGEEYSFIWKKGSYDTECGFVIYDINGDIILSKEGCNSGCESPAEGAVLLDYTMNCSGCARPQNPHASNISGQEATLNWESNAAAWHLCLDGDEENFITLTDPVYHWAGLAANSTHSFKVRSVCDDDVSSWTNEVSFTTTCAAVTYLFEFFETTDPNEASCPDCWQLITESNDSGIFPHVSSSTDYAYSGNNVLYYASVAGYATDQYAILPELVSLEGKRIKFVARKQSASWENVTMTVGVMTDPSDPTTFVAVESFTVSSIEHRSYNVSFADYTGDGKFIAIKMDAAETNYAVLIIDDVIVNDIPTCMEPTNLNFSEITKESATLTWESDAEAWKVYIDGQEEDYAIVTEKSYTFTGLTPATEYSATVIAYCSEEETSPGEYILFATACDEAPVALPYFEGFETPTRNCWTLISNDRNSRATTTAPFEGTYSFSFQWNLVQDLYQYLISPELETSENEVSLEFYYAISRLAYSPEAFRVGYSLSSDDVEDETWVWSDEIEAENVYSSNWESYTQTLPAGVKFVAIAYTAYDKEHLYIDNISLEEIEPEPEPCPSQLLPFHETFEENSETLNCWTLILNLDEGSDWAWDSDNNHFIRFYATAEPQYIISPELYPADMNARISFIYKSLNSNFTESFQLGYSYDGIDLANFEWTDELLAEDAENWSTFAIVVGGGVQYVAIRYNADVDQYGLLIDEIYVQSTDKPTDVEALKNNAQIYKFVKDGNLFILRNGKLFNAQGKFVK